MWTDRQSAHKAESVPYTEEFAEEISEAATEFYMPMMKDCEEHGQNPEGAPQMDIKIGGSSNHLYTGELETYPRADGNFFVVKPYGHVQGLDVAYFEIYSFDGDRGTMLTVCPHVSYTSLCCDGEFFYYIFKDKLCRVSKDGAVDEIVDFEVYNPENPDDEIYPSCLDTVTEFDGDTLKVTVGFYRGGDTASYNKTNTYIINVADLSVETINGEFDEREKSDGGAAPEEKVAPINPIPSTVSERVPDFQTTDPLAEPIFELDEIRYEQDVLNLGYDFIMDENGDILIVTYNVGEEPVEISEYARSIREEQGWEPPEILTALRELDTLEYIGRAELIEDTANAFEYHNSDLYYYQNKILLIEPISAEDNLYSSTMFKPCG